MTITELDALVIGAGVAGLSAARILDRAGLRIALIEARNRVGGRIATRHDPALPLPVELGAEFIHGLPPETWAIVRAAMLPTYEAGGVRWWWRKGSLIPRDALWSRAEEILAQLDQPTIPDRSFQAFLDAGFQSTHWRAARPVVTAYVEGYNAAWVDRLSVQSLAREYAAATTISGHRSFRIFGGYDQIAHWMLTSLDPEFSTLYLGAQATHMYWRPGAVELNVRSPTGTEIGPFRAPRALLTLPLGVLKAPMHAPGVLRFIPALLEKQAAAARLEMGQAIKIILRFREAFWERHSIPAAGAPLERLGFLHSRGEPFPTWWTTYPAQSPILTGWAGGAAARQLLGASEPVVVEQALVMLARLLGLTPHEIAAQLDGWHIHDWYNDPLARGAYSYVPVGHLDAQAMLGKPVEQTLFFAGEATDVSGHTGTVHGAIASGVRAARELLAAHGR